MQVRALKGIRLPGSQLIYCIIFLYSIKDYLAICLLVVIICNIWLSYWSPAPSTTPLPISEPHSKIVRMNKLLDKEQAAAVDMTWHICSPQLDMDFFLCRQLYHYKRYRYQSLDCWTWWIWQEAVHCDGSGMNNCFLPDTHHIQHSTAQQQLSIWNSSSQSLVMQNVKNVRRRIDKRRKVNLKLLCNNRTEVCLKNSMKTVGSGTDWSPQQQTQI